MSIKIDGNTLTIEEFRQIAVDCVPVGLTEETKAGIRLSRNTLEDFIKTGKAYYGINTGFGALASKKINSADLKQLQRNLIKSHTAGVGEALPDHIVRGTILLRANVLAKGYSGVRLELLELMRDMINAGLAPYIPECGSVGASGDAYLVLATNLSLNHCWCRKQPDARLSAPAGR
jgi:histidine ammonia-lyase